MEDFKIILSEDDILVLEETSVEIETVLYVQAGETVFPNSLWTDYTLSVLSMWSEAFLRHRALTRQAYSLPFMDGPFEIEVLQEDGQMILRGINSRRERREDFRCTISIEQFRRELLRAWNQLRRIVWFFEAFQKEGSKRTTLETIDHYRKLFENECPS